MKCRGVLERIEEYHYGELKQRAARKVGLHLSGCQSCSQALASLAREDEIYRAYGSGVQEELEVTPSMWNRVRDGFVKAEEEKRTLFGLRLGLIRQAVYASFLVIFSVCGTLLVVHYYKGGAPVQVRVFTEKAAEPKSLETALLSIQRAEQEYIDAIEVLSGIVEKRKETLDPRLAAELERNLRAIDEGIASTRKAYHAHPADPELAHYMLTAYQKKIELLQELAS